MKHNFKYNLKFIKKSKLEFLVMISVLAIIFSASLTLIGSKTFINDMVYTNIENSHYRIDSTLTIDSASETRFFSTTELNNFKEEIADKIEILKLPYFLSSPAKEPVNFLLTNINDAGRFLPDLKSKSLSGNRIIITKTFASKYQVYAGDSISVIFNNQEEELIIQEVLPDYGFINSRDEIKIIANEEFMLKLFFGESYYFFENVKNLVYFKLNSDVNILDFEEKLQLYYPSYSIPQQYLHIEAQEFIKEISSSVTIFSILFALPTILCLALIIIVFFQQRKSTLVILKNAGYNKKELSLFFLPLFLIYSITATIIGGIIIFFSLMWIAFLTFGISYFISTNFLLILLLTVVFFNLIIFGVYFTIFHFSYQKNILFKSKKIKNKTILNYLYSFLLFSISLYYLLFPASKIKALIIYIAVIILLPYLTINAFKLLLMLVIKVRKKAIGKIFLKELSNNNNKKFYLIILTYFIVVSSFSFIYYQQFSAFPSKNYALQNDLILISNITDSNQKIVNDFNDNFEIDYYAVGNVYNKIVINDKEKIDYLITLDSTDYNHFFNWDVDGDITKLENKEIPYLILTENYKYNYNYQINDKVNLKITNNQVIEFTIAGFMDTSASLVQITNYGNLDINQNINFNYLLMKSPDISNIKEYYYSNYLNKMYFLVTSKDLYLKMESENQNYIPLLLSFGLIIIFSFAITLYALSILIFGSSKRTFSRLIIFGYSNFDIAKILAVEVFIRYLIVLLFGITATMILTENFSYLLIFFASYFQFFAVNPLSFTFLIIIIAFDLAINFNFYLKCKNLKIIEENKIY